MKRILYILLAIIGVLAIIAFGCYRYASRQYDKLPTGIYLPNGIGESEFNKILTDSLGADYASAVFNIWKLRGGKMSNAHGHFQVKSGESAYDFAMRLRGGIQDPVQVVIPNLRECDRVIDVIASQLELSTEDLNKALNDVMTKNKIDQQNLPALILPDTYQFYWTAKPAMVANSIFDRWYKFWDRRRMTKADLLRLTPLEVSTLASIVEEESSKVDERPVIARLYLNRLKKGMKLQADPTVKFALGDPSLRRILNTHLTVESPYNTYLIDGLPPGPIRVVDKATIDAVLNAPKHDYLFMCAKDDFSGYHNFARTNAEHAANAKKYHAALNRAQINK